MGGDPTLYNYFNSISPLAFMAQPINWSDPKYDEKTYFTPHTNADVLKLAIDKSKLLSYCMFDGVRIENCASAFEDRFTFSGLCYTWNNKGEVTTRMTGHSFNLYLNLNIFQHLYYWSDLVAAGVKVNMGEI